MKITTHMLADEVYEAVNDNSNKVTIDMRKREDKVDLSPVELVLAALAGCGAGLTPTCAKASAGKPDPLRGRGRNSLSGGGVDFTLILSVIQITDHRLLIT